MFEPYLAYSVYVVTIVCGLPLIAGSACALALNLLQAVTQIQEQSATFLARLAAVAVVLFLFRNWFSSLLLRFFQESLLSLAWLGNTS